MRSKLFCSLLLLALLLSGCSTAQDGSQLSLIPAPVDLNREQQVLKPFHFEAPASVEIRTTGVDPAKELKTSVTAATAAKANQTEAARPASATAPLMTMPAVGAPQINYTAPSQYEAVNYNYETVPEATYAEAIEEPVESSAETTLPPETDTAQSSSELSDIVSAAANHMSLFAYSRSGLIYQLISDGYTETEAVNAADTCGANWYTNAVAAAGSHLSTMFYSRASMVSQLQYDGFSSDESAYGADNCGADWMAQAAYAAANLFASGIQDHDNMVVQLQALGFTMDEAVYGASVVGL